jgi:hypothetical protein
MPGGRKVLSGRREFDADVVGAGSILGLVVPPDAPRDAG